MAGRTKHGIYEVGKEPNQPGLMSPEDKTKLDSLGDLTSAKLARLAVLLAGGTTGQVLSVKADGTLEWKSLT